MHKYQNTSLSKFPFVNSNELYSAVVAARRTWLLKTKTHFSQRAFHTLLHTLLRRCSAYWRRTVKLLAYWCNGVIWIWHTFCRE